MKHVIQCYLPKVEFEHTCIYTLYIDLYNKNTNPKIQHPGRAGVVAQGYILRYVCLRMRQFIHIITFKLTSNLVFNILQDNISDV